MGVLVVLMSWVGVLGLASARVAAADDFKTCDGMLLGIFRPWYMGLATGAKCEIKVPPSSDGSGLTKFVWTIVFNILSDLFAAVGILAIGFLIYGGYLYVLARGDPGKVAKGKRTVMSAVIGLVIAVLASAISATIVTIMTEGGAA